MTNASVDNRGYLPVPPGRRESGDEDISCGIYVRVAGPATRHAPEHRLALTVFSGAVPAAGTLLRCVCRVDFHDLSACLSSLVMQRLLENSPAFAENASIQASLGGHMSAGMIDRARSTRGHILNAQVFDPDQRVVAAQLVGKLLVEVNATSSYARPDLGDLEAIVDGAAGVLGSSFATPKFLPTAASLQSLHSSLLAECDEVAVMQTAIRICNSDFDAAVKSGLGVRKAMARRCCHVVFDQYRYRPMATSPTNGNRPDHACRWSRPAQTDPAQLGQANLTRFAAKPLNDNAVFALRQAHRRPPSRLGSPSHRERSMRLARPVQIHQRLLQRIRWRFSQPRKLKFGRGHFSALLCVADPRVAPPVFAALRQSCVPHRTANAGPRFQLSGLLARRCEPVLESLEHSRILKGGYDIMFGPREASS